MGLWLFGGDGFCVYMLFLFVGCLFLEVGFGVCVWCLVCEFVLGVLCVLGEMIVVGVGFRVFWCRCLVIKGGLGGGESLK